MISILVPEVMQRVDHRVGDDLIATAIHGLMHPSESAYSEIEIDAWAHQISDLLIQLGGDNGQFSVLVKNVELADPCDVLIFRVLLRELPAELVQLTMCSRVDVLSESLMEALCKCGIQAERVKAAPEIHTIE